MFLGRHRKEQPPEHPLDQLHLHAAGDLVCRDRRRGAVGGHFAEGDPDGEGGGAADGRIDGGQMQRQVRPRFSVGPEGGGGEARRVMGRQQLGGHLQPLAVEACDRGDHQQGIARHFRHRRLTCGVDGDVAHPGPRGERRGEVGEHAVVRGGRPAVQRQGVRHRASFTKGEAAALWRESLI